MNTNITPNECAVPTLMLFVTGNAPRSVRARKNLAAALDALGLVSVEPMEIDLLARPDQTLTYSVFATPALLRLDEDGQMRVIYGDLSEETKLVEFLRELS